MIDLILGKTGSGKTTLLTERLLNDLKNEKQVILLVPEQQALAAESAVHTACHREGVATASLEVLNFTRLANRIFREFGGLSYRYADTAARSLVIWLTLCRLSQNLRIFGRVTSRDNGTISLLEKTVSSLKRYRVTPKMLLDAAEALSEDPERKRLCDKLHDLGLLAAEYQALLTQRYQDPGDDSEKTVRILDEHNFFAGKQVYMDSYYGFTPDQTAILSRIFRQAENVTLAFPKIENQGEHSFASLAKTMKMLRRLAQKSHCQVRETVLEDKDYRHTDSALATLAEVYADDSVFQTNQTEFKDALTVRSCRTVYEECEAVAADIAARVRKAGSNLRYRDCLVVTSGVERYDGVLQIAFDKYHIPYDMTVRRSLESQPLIRLILSALQIIDRRWQTEDVISYLKNPLSGVEPSLACDIQEYAQLWKIVGSMWYGADAWCMSPNGYQAVSDSSQASVRNMDEKRRAIAASLSELEDSLNASGEGLTVKQGCIAVYTFLEKSHVRARMEGNTEEEVNRIWNAMSDSLDILVDVCGDSVVTLPVLIQLLSLVFRCREVGNLPSTVDQVTVGDAFTVRAGEAKQVYLIGLNEGIFPKLTANAGLFDERDLTALESVELELAQREEDCRAMAEYHLYRSLCASTQGVHLFYAETNPKGEALLPSCCITRIKALFSELNIDTEGNPLKEALTVEVAAEIAARQQKTRAGKLLAEALKEAKEENRLDVIGKPLYSITETVSGELASKYLNTVEAQLKDAGKSEQVIVISPSGYDLYRKCPLSYFGNYFLKIREIPESGFTAANRGSYAHYIVEKVIASLKNDGQIGQEIGKEELEKRIDAVSAEYFDLIMPYQPLKTERVKRLLDRLNRMLLYVLLNITAEYRASGFQPLWLEKTIAFPNDPMIQKRQSGKDGTDTPLTPSIIRLSDGQPICFHGTVDRVDIMKNGEDCLVRVVDYKSSASSYSLDEDKVKKGESQQMLQYLSAVVEQEQNQDLLGFLGENGKILPYQVMYSFLTFDSSKLNQPVTEEEMTDVLCRKIEHAKQISSTEKNAVDFDTLFTQVKNNVTNTVEQIRAGVADASPSEQNCRYCRYLPLCRNKNMNDAAEKEGGN